MFFVNAENAALPLLTPITPNSPAGQLATPPKPGSLPQPSLPATSQPALPSATPLVPAPVAPAAAVTSPVLPSAGPIEAQSSQPAAPKAPTNLDAAIKLSDSKLDLNLDAVLMDKIDEIDKSAEKISKDMIADAQNVDKAYQASDSSRIDFIKQAKSILNDASSFYTEMKNYVSKNKGALKDDALSKLNMLEMGLGELFKMSSDIENSIKAINDSFKDFSGLVSQKDDAVFASRKAQSSLDNAKADFLGLKPSAAVSSKDAKLKELDGFVQQINSGAEKIKNIKSSADAKQNEISNKMDTIKKSFEVVTKKKDELFSMLKEIADLKEKQVTTEEAALLNKVKPTQSPRAVTTKKSGLKKMFDDFAEKGENLVDEPTQNKKNEFLGSSQANSSSKPRGVVLEFIYSVTQGAAILFQDVKAMIVAGWTKIHEREQSKTSTALPAPVTLSATSLPATSSAQPPVPVLPILPVSSPQAPAASAPAAAQPALPSFPAVTSSAAPIAPLLPSNPNSGSASVAAPVQPVVTPAAEAKNMVSPAQLKVVAENLANSAKEMFFSAKNFAFSLVSYVHAVYSDLKK